MRAPLELRYAGGEPPAQDAALGFQRLERDGRIRHVDLPLGHRAERLQAARDEFQRLVIRTFEREPRLAAPDGSFAQGIQ